MLQLQSNNVIGCFPTRTLNVTFLQWQLPCSVSSSAADAILVAIGGMEREGSSLLSDPSHISSQVSISFNSAGGNVFSAGG